MRGPWIAALGVWSLAVFAVWLVVPFVLAGSVIWRAGGSTLPSSPAARPRRAPSSPAGRYVHHPGYLGLALWALGTPLLLRSLWSAGAALAAAARIVLRTALEDATLREELPGYLDYARPVRAAEPCDFVLRVTGAT